MGSRMGRRRVMETSQILRLPDSRLSLTLHHQLTACTIAHALHRCSLVITIYSAAEESVNPLLPDLSHSLV